MVKRPTPHWHCIVPLHPEDSLSPAAPDFRLDGCKAINTRVRENIWQNIMIEQDVLSVLAPHHTDGGQRSYHVLHHGAAT
ncbi:MAG: hypothetical protein JO362_21095 [Streptomycetaceae bacterium]|nr:hypothetical protein [Streptomycetaceae bacterium]